MGINTAVETYIITHLISCFSKGLRQTLFSILEKKKFTVLFKSLNESVRQVQICLADTWKLEWMTKKQKTNSTHFSLVKYDDVTDKQGVVYLMCIVDFDIAFNRKFPPATSITSVTFQESASVLCSQICWNLKLLYWMMGSFQLFCF